MLLEQNALNERKIESSEARCGCILRGSKVVVIKTLKSGAVHNTSFGNHAITSLFYKPDRSRNAFVLCHVRFVRANSFFLFRLLTISC